METLKIQLENERKALGITLVVSLVLIILVGVLHEGYKETLINYFMYIGFFAPFLPVIFSHSLKKQILNSVWSILFVIFLGYCFWLYQDMPDPNCVGSNYDCGGGEFSFENYFKPSFIILAGLSGFLFASIFGFFFRKI